MSLMSDFLDKVNDHVALATGALGAGPVGAVAATVESVPVEVRALLLGFLVVAARFLFKDEFRRVRARRLVRRERRAAVRRGGVAVRVKSRRVSART